MTLHQFAVLAVVYVAVCGLSLWLASKVLP